MQKRTHGSILIISHQERILEIADTIILIADGQVRSQGSRDEMLPELMKSTVPVTCNRILEGGVSNAQ
jgi:Fe-S cluster assembly ATP-binding protein